MKLWDVIRSVGSAALQVALPGTGSLIVGAVNELLPNDKKLTANATGDDISSAISSLPPAQQATILSKEFDVSITQIKESNSTVRAMLESDANNPHTTRPYIAKGAFHIIAFVIGRVGVVPWRANRRREDSSVGYERLAVCTGRYRSVSNATMGLLWCTKKRAQEQIRRGERTIDPCRVSRYTG